NCLGVWGEFDDESVKYAIQRLLQSVYVGEVRRGGGSREVDIPGFVERDSPSLVLVDTTDPCGHFAQQGDGRAMPERTLCERRTAGLASVTATAMGPQHKRQ